MTQNVRLNKKEQEILRKKSIAINQQLIKKGIEPLRDSQIIHIILEKGLERLEVSEKGEITLF